MIATVSTPTSKHPGRFSERTTGTLKLLLVKRHREALTLHDEHVIREAFLLLFDAPIDVLSITRFLVKHVKIEIARHERKYIREDVEDERLAIAIELLAAEPTTDHCGRCWEKGKPARKAVYGFGLCEQHLRKAVGLPKPA